MAAKNRNTFEKTQREVQKKRKAEEKRERRRAKKVAPHDQGESATAAVAIDATQQDTPE